MKRVLAKPPLFYVVAQVRFNPVLSIAASIEKLQDKWRTTFPDFSHEMTREIQVDFANQSFPPEVKATETPRWDFTNAKKTSGLSLTPKSLTFQTTRYETSDQFVTEFMSGLRDLNEYLSLAYVDGVGFRILDAVIPEQNQPLAYYLNPRLLGLYGELDGEFVQSIFQLSQKRVFGSLVTRTIILNSKIGLPADLIPIKLNFRSEVADLEGVHAVLDNDISQNDRFTFDLGEIETRLRILKEGLNDAFYNSVTSEALESWSR